MAAFIKILLWLALGPLLFMQTASGETAINCEDLSRGNCAFAVSDSGHRCVLERHVSAPGKHAYSCRASLVDAADNLRNWVESNYCIQTCGLKRNVLGISSDSLLDPRFAAKLCSEACLDSCPNIVDLYFNLAAGEGVFLPKFCANQRSGLTRRGLTTELQSSSEAELSVGGHGVAEAPEGSPEADFSELEERVLMEFDEKSALPAMLGQTPAPAPAPL